MHHIKKTPKHYPSEIVLKNLFNMCAFSLKNFDLPIISLSLTDWSNSSNDVLFFGFYLDAMPRRVQQGQQYLTKLQGAT